MLYFSQRNVLSLYLVQEIIKIIATYLSSIFVGDGSFLLLKFL